MTVKDLNLKLSGKIEKKAEQLEETDYERYFTKLLQINLDNLTRYYLLVGEQAAKSFWLTVATAMGGFVILVFGIALSFFSIQGVTVTAETVAVASGLIVEFIAGVMFYIYNRTVKQLGTYHDKLLRVQDLILALKLTQSIGDPTVMNRNLEYLARSIVGYQTAAATLQDIPVAEVRDLDATDYADADRNGQNMGSVSQPSG